MEKPFENCNTETSVTGVNLFSMTFLKKHENL